MTIWQMTVWQCCQTGQFWWRAGQNRRYEYRRTENRVYTTLKEVCCISRGPQLFWHRRLVLWKTIFPRTGEGGWFGDDSSTLHLLCTLFLLLLHCDM